MAFKLSNLWKGTRQRTLNHDAKSSTIVLDPGPSAPEQSPSVAVEEDLELSTPISSPGPTGVEADMAALLSIKLPPLPNAAMRVAELCRDVNTSSSVVADAIGYDPSLAARILRAANSTLYSREREVTALTTAVKVLGLRTLHQLTISYAASSLFDRPSPSHEERMLWRHAVFVALASRAITLSFGLHGSEESFLCGLLHDVGKGLMIQHDEKRYTKLLTITDEDVFLAAERDTYGFTHPQLSAMVVNHWGLASDVSDAILNHHQPDEAVHSLLVTRALRVADKLAHASGFSITQHTDVDVNADESAYLLGLSEVRLGEIREQVEESMSEMMHILLK